MDGISSLRARLPGQGEEMGRPGRRVGPRRPLEESPSEIGAESPRTGVFPPCAGSSRNWSLPSDRALRPSPFGPLRQSIRRGHPRSGRRVLPSTGGSGGRLHGRPEVAPPGGPGMSSRLLGVLSAGPGGLSGRGRPGASGPPGTGRGAPPPAGRAAGNLRDGGLPSLVAGSLCHLSRTSLDLSHSRGSRAVPRGGGLPRERLSAQLRGRRRGHPASQRPGPDRVNEILVAVNVYYCRRQGQDPGTRSTMSRILASVLGAPSQGTIQDEEVS